jgi:hypothetical protein
MLSVGLMFDTNSLFASLIWGSAGIGYFIFGKKQRAWAPMVGGLIMLFVSYAAGSALLMSLICVAIMAAVYFLSRQVR